MKRIALITGANKGLGFQTALELGRAGLTILVGARNEERGNAAVEKLKAEGIDASFVQLDMQDPSSISAAVRTITGAYGKLDVLVNNAGIIHPEEDWMINTVATVPINILKMTFETNFFGLIDLTQQLLPLIKKGERPVIVNVSSILGSLATNNDSESMYYSVKPFSYNASKAALNSFTIHLAAALKEDGIAVNSAHPGWVKTDLGTDAAPLNVNEGAKTIVDLALNEDASYSGHFVHMGEELPW